MSYLVDFEGYQMKHRAMVHERAMAQGRAYQHVERQAARDALDGVMLRALNQLLSERSDLALSDGARRRLASEFAGRVLEAAWQ
jgi:hypothetical protein